MINLNDKILLRDGTVVVSSAAEAILLRHEHNNEIKIKISPEDIEEVKKYNKLSDSTLEIWNKKDSPIADITYTLPPPYDTIDVVDFVVTKQQDSHFWTTMPTIEKTARLKRLEKELTLFADQQMFDLLRTLIYIVNTLKEQNVCWGVGRGSSVASYVLYVLEVHDVDSFKFKLPLVDFFKEAARSTHKKQSK